MADIVLSIHPRHSQDILELRKTKELRRCIPAQTVDRVVIYETAPTMLIVGEFTVACIISAPPGELWTSVDPSACVTREEFLEYFGPRPIGHAFEVGTVSRYDLDPRKVDPFWTPPQSFAYLSQALRRAIDTRDDVEWLTLEEVTATLDQSPGQTAALARQVPVGPEYMRARMVDGERVTLYSPAAVELIRG